MHGQCFDCGYKVDLPPGIYPPDSIEFPPGWTKPDITVTVEADGTPTYDEDEEPTTTSTTTFTSTTAFTSQMPHTSINPTSSVSSSATSSEDFLCEATYSSFIDLPLSSPRPKVKRMLYGETALKVKRVMAEPGNTPYDGNMNAFMLGQLNGVEKVVNLRQGALLHLSSSMFYPLLDSPLDLAVAGLFGCTSLIVASTKGVWMSHFWEGPSFNATFRRPGITSAQQQYVFQRTVMDYLGPGDGTPDFPGLLQYIGPGKEFGPETHVRAAIITPTSRQDPNEILYPGMIYQIVQNVTRMFGGDLDTDPSGSMAEPIIYLDYRPRSSRNAQQSTAAGKAIFQYDPVQARCVDPKSGQPTQIAAQQLWFEVNPRPFLWHYWDALPEQFVPPTPRPGTGSKRRGLPSNETTNGQHHIHLEKREEAWIPGVQPSVYPACLAAIENNGSIPETTAALVGPSGPVEAPQIIYTEAVAATAGSGTVLYGCTATTVDHDTAACTGSMTPIITLFPTITTTSISTTAMTTNTVLLPSECMNQDTFTSYHSCMSSCAAGHCEEYQEKKKKRVLCEAVGDCGAWRCFC